MTKPPVVGVSAVLVLMSLVSSAYLRAQQVETVPRNQTTTRGVRPFTPVTDAVLRDPDPEDWLMIHRTYDFQAYSPLDQITRDNVGQLQLAWIRAMDAGPQEIRPLVYDGVMYIAHPGSDHLQALDATSGDLIWDYRRDWPADLREYAALGNRTRNVSIYGSHIFHLTADSHLIALDARTGEQVWESQLADYRDGITHSSGPMIIEGKVLSGRACSSRIPTSRCFIAAHDSETGTELWRVYTAAGADDPGGQTWGNVPTARRGHVSPWGVPRQLRPRPWPRLLGHRGALALYPSRPSWDLGCRRGHPLRALLQFDRGPGCGHR